MSRRPPLARAALLGLAASLAIAPACLCATPSAEVDGGDLLGVFARDGGADGAPGADGGKPRGKRGKDAGSDAERPAPTAAPSASVRAPAEGSCAAEVGRPDRDLRRTLGRPPCRGAQVSEWKDADGSPRYACIYAPPGVETRAPLPLIVFFHDEEDDPSSVAKKTNLPKLSATYNVSGDVSHTGFIVVAPQGRALRSGKRGSVFDAEYTGPDNQDVATVDHFVGELDKRGLVDKRRIYTLGSSYGGHMAVTYAMMRADRVAAFAAFAADAPPASWSCGGPPTPGIVLYRACDAVISCESVERWLRARDAARAETTYLRLSPGLDEEPSCAPKNKCTPKRAEGNHHRFPKGREGEVLAFFAKHALGAASQGESDPQRDPQGASGAPGAGSTRAPPPSP